MDSMDSDYSHSGEAYGDWASSPRQRRKLTQDETFKKLDELDDEYIENYLRAKKLKKLKKKQ